MKMIKKDVKIMRQENGMSGNRGIFLFPLRSSCNGMISRRKIEGANENTSRPHLHNRVLFCMTHVQLAISINNKYYFATSFHVCRGSQEDGRNNCQRVETQNQWRS